MPPPETHAAGPKAGAAARSPAVSSCPTCGLAGLRHRAEFLKAARSRRQGTAGFLLQARCRAPDEADPRLMRVGFTASKKIGNAVLRNRARRRLRAVAREVLPADGRPGWDYVLVARPEATVARRHADLVADLRHALAGIHRSDGHPGGRSPGGSRTEDAGADGAGADGAGAERTGAGGSRADASRHGPPARKGAPEPDRPRRGRGGS